jgi:hypothetical protein
MMRLEGIEWKTVRYDRDREFGQQAAFRGTIREPFAGCNDI